MNNMNTSKIIACGATLLLSSCGIYTSYKPQTSVPENLYGEEVTGGCVKMMHPLFVI